MRTFPFRSRWIISITYIIISISFTTGFTGCHRISISAQASSFESEERASWQKPDLILDKMGDLKEKTVADIGAATGYFTFRLADRGARVLSLDVDDSWIDYLKEKKAKLKDRETAGRVEIRKIPYHSPELSPEEADRVLLVNVYHHLNRDSRIDYLKRIGAGLKKNGKLFIIDFYDRERPVGPPPGHYLVPEETVLFELKESGFQVVEQNKELPYQFFIIAEHP